MEKTSSGALDVGHCHSKSLDKLYTWTAESLLLLILIASKYNNQQHNYIDMMGTYPLIKTLPALVDLSTNLI